MTRQIDMHAHLIPPAVVDALVAHPDRFPVTAERLDAGKVRFHVQGEEPTRPVAPPMMDLRERLAWLDREGLERQVVGGWLDIFGNDLPGEQGAAWARFLNEEMAGALDGNPRLVGLATVPLQDGRLAAAELRHAMGSLGMRGTMIGTRPQGRELDDPDLEPFWAAAAELEAFILLHPVYGGGAERLKGLPGFPNGIARPYETALSTARIIFGGVLDRHPGLRICLSHGGGYLPFQLGRLELIWRVEKYQISHPAEQLRRLYYDSVLFDPRALRFLAELVGPDRILCGSDYPFPVADFQPADILIPAGLDPRAVRRISDELLG